MNQKGATGKSLVDDAREAYFAGKISADEYLRRALAPSDDDHPMAEQFRRIFGRFNKSNNP